MRNFFALILISATITIKQVRDEGCRAACSKRYSSGSATENGCRCFDEFDDYEEFVSGRIKLGTSLQDPVVYEKEDNRGTISVSIPNNIVNEIFSSQ